MTNYDVITKTLDDLRREGYTQVSVSELASKLGMPSRAILTIIKHSHLPNVRRGNETFVLLLQVPAVATFSDLAKPKSGILSDL